MASATITSMSVKPDFMSAVPAARGRPGLREAAGHFQQQARALAVGGLRMAAVPGLRSWPALGGGLAVLLLPTLLLGPGELWRVLGLVGGVA